MNKPAFFLVPLIILMLMNNIYAEYTYPVAVSKYGILVGKYRISTDTQNSIPDTITLEVAKSIFALNAYYLDKKDGPHKLDITEFQMTIINVNDTIKLISKSEIFTEELRKKINNLKSGSNLYFEGINGKFPNGDTRAVILLAFYIK